MSDHIALARIARHLHRAAVRAHRDAEDFPAAAGRYLLQHHQLRREAHRHLMRARWVKSVAMEGDYALFDIRPGDGL